MNITTLRDRLAKGLYVDNLEEMAAICKQLALDTKYPVPFFILNCIFSMIALDWDRALSVEEAKRVETELRTPIDQLLNSLDGDDATEIYFRIQDLVSKYLTLF